MGGNKGKDSEEQQAQHEDMGFLGGVASTVNYIVGAGLLGIPGVMAKAGLVLSPLVILAMGCIMDFTKDLMLEALARAEAVAKVAHITANRLKEKAGLKEHHDVEGDNHSTNGHSDDALIVPTQREYLVHGRRKFEVTDQLLLFIGKKSQVAYLFGLCLYMFGTLLSYSVIAASSVTANVSLDFLPPYSKCDVTKQDCYAPYRFWLAIFAAIVIPFSAMEIREQLWMQVIMFLARILVMILLAGTAAVGLSCDGVAFAEVAPGTAGKDVPLANATGLGSLIPTAIFAFIFHHSIPALSNPIKDKTSLNKIFRTALLLVGACYIALGVCVALFFGSTVDSQCNLNWTGYVGCMPPPPGYTPPPLSSSSPSSPEVNAAFPGYGALAGSSNNPLRSAAAACTNSSTWSESCVDISQRPGWATAVAYIILLFPALDVLSAFPLNALTLGNNLMSAILGEAALTQPSDEEEERFWKHDHEAQEQVATKSSFWRWAFVGKYKSSHGSGEDGHHGHGSFVDSATRAGTAAITAVKKASSSALASVKSRTQGSGLQGKLPQESSVPFLEAESKASAAASGAGAAGGETATADAADTAAASVADAAAAKSGEDDAGARARAGSKTDGPKGKMLTLNIAASASAANVIVSPGPATAKALSAGAKGGKKKGAGPAAVMGSAPAGVGKLKTPLPGGKLAKLQATDGEGMKSPLSPTDTEDDVVDLTHLNDADGIDGSDDDNSSTTSGSTDVDGEDEAVVASSAEGAAAAAAGSFPRRPRRGSARDAADAHHHHHHHHHGPQRPLYMRTKRGHRATTIAFRMLAAIPPICVAFAVDDLGNVLQFTGLVGVAISFTVPAALAIFSLAKQRAIFGALSAYLLKRFGIDFLASTTSKPSPATLSAAQTEMSALVSSLPSASAVLEAIDTKSAGMQESGLLTPPPATSIRRPPAHHASSVVVLSSATPGGASSAGTPTNTAAAAYSGDGAAAYTSTSGLDGDGSSPAPHLPLMEESQLIPLGAAALKASSCLGFKEALTLRTEVDRRFWLTPYSPRFKCRRAAEWVFGFSIIIAVFVLVMIILNYIQGE